MGARANKALSRVYSEFINSQRYIELIRTVTARIEDSDAILEYLSTMRWVDTAEGIWLDMVGEIIGIPRFYEEFTGPFFEYKDAYPGVDDSTKAYGDAYPNPDPAAGGPYQSISGMITDVLQDDDAYRKWIKAKATATGSAGNPDDIYLFIKTAMDIETNVYAGDVRTVYINPVSPLSSWKESKIREWAPINSGIDLWIVD
jgi:hypothetical protein